MNEVKDNISVTGDNEILKAFIEKNYDKITTRMFNIPGFFFTTFYLFYRKMFLYGILSILIQLGLSLVTKNFYFGFILNILLGLFVNKIYLIFANKKINKIKNENPSVTNAELSSLCSSKGGTSGLYVFFGILIELFVSVLVILIVLPLGIFQGLNSLMNNGNININLNSDNDNNVITDFNEFSDYGNDVYNGMLIYKSDVKINEMIEITVPSVFSDNSFDYDSEISYSYSSGEEIFNSCKVKLAIVDGFSSSDVLINGMHNYNKDYTPTDVDKLTINDNVWTWFRMKDSIGTEYYYAADIDNLLYLLEYDVEESTDSNCELYREEIVNSIKVK